MASILNKSGSAIRASANAIPNYSCLEKLRTVPLRSALKLDNSASFTNGKMARRDTRIWTGCVSVGLDGPLQIRLAHTDVAQVPDFTKYRRKQTKEPSARSEESDIDRRIFSYTLLFGGSVAGLMLARDTVSGLLGTMGPNAKTLAAATSEIDLSTIPEGKSVVFKWRNKPLFVRHRTAEEIERERQVIQSELRDPQDDADRVQKDQWLIVLGICTHLGCVPIANAGDYGGYYCPCHGSHYDGSGRIRKGPAPLNLEIPPYKFVSDTLVLVG